MHHRPTLRMSWRRCLVCVLLVAGCSPVSSPPPPAPQAVKPPSFDLQKVIDTVHFAFREEPRGFLAAHATHEVISSRDGLLLTPFHFPAEPKGASAIRGKSLELAATRISRGGKNLALAAKPRVEKDGHLVWERDELEEHLRNTAAGLQQ